MHVHVSEDVHVHEGVEAWVVLRVVSASAPSPQAVWHGGGGAHVGANGTSSHAIAGWPPLAAACVHVCMYVRAATCCGLLISWHS